MKEWTEEEDKRLRALILDGVSSKVIARKLGRSIWSIKKRLSRLELKRPEPFKRNLVTSYRFSDETREKLAALSSRSGKSGVRVLTEMIDQAYLVLQLSNHGLHD